MTCQKALLITSDYFVSDIADASLLGNNNYKDNNVDINSKANSNSDENMTGKNDDNFFQGDFVTHIEELFQQVQD